MQNQYPLWKNLLLVFLLLVAIIYAMPNLFGDDPAIQISSSSTAIVLTRNISDRTKDILDKNNIEYLRIESQKDGLLVRFKDADAQIKARDIVKTNLGDDYVVALNLASRTPKWLGILGASPMKLGLDLRGGVHFLLEVDLNDMIKKREDGDIRSIINELREAGIRYLSIERIKPHGVIVTFHDVENLDKAQDKLGDRLQDYIFIKITTGGVAKLKVAMSEKAVFKVADYAIEQTANILRNRVNELGVSEAIVQRQGRSQVSVDLPGIQDTVRAKEIIGKTATLRFQMEDYEHDVASAMEGDLPIGSRLYEYEGRPVLLKDKIILQGNSITYATASYSQTGRPSVSIRLGGGGERTFHRTTAENIGKALAIVYVETKPEQKIIDGKKTTISRTIERVISIATIQSALGNNFEITGLKSEKYAQDLALLLRSGALVAPVTIVEETTVGPSMGKANIDKGILSIAVGYIFILLFMAFYYSFFGLVSGLALLLNLVFIVAILSLLGATLTLPGMAGMVLTVGMTVDASVLIFERIREELRSGISPQASIYTGYERAFSTIVDANVTTLIVAIVLFALGTGAVKGFAVVLSIGLMTSMLTSIVFTRAIVNLIYGGRNLKKLPIGMRN